MRKKCSKCKVYMGLNSFHKAEHGLYGVCSVCIDGMTWGNYGINGWTIDHKIPISVFNFTSSDHEDFKRCWALSNLQPLWAYDNISKGAKLTKHFQPSLLI